MLSEAKLASIEVRAVSQITVSPQEKALATRAYSRGRSVPIRLGSSVFIETRTPARTSRSIGCSAIEGKNPRLIFDMGQTPIGTFFSTSSLAVASSA